MADNSRVAAGSKRQPDWWWGTPPTTTRSEQVYKVRKTEGRKQRRVTEGREGGREAGQTKSISVGWLVG